MAAKKQKTASKMTTPAIVALVALAGMVMIYSEMSPAPTGAYETSQASWAMSIKVGELCGQCGLLASKGLALPEECYKSTSSEGLIFRPNDYRGSYNCCRRACLSTDIVGRVGITSNEQCNSICIKAANDVFTGTVRYSGNPFDVPKFS